MNKWISGYFYVSFLGYIDPVRPSIGYQFPELRDSSIAALAPPEVS